VSSIHTIPPLSPRLAAAIDRRFGGLTLQPETIEDVAASVRALSDFINDDTETPDFVYNMLGLYGESEAGVGPPSEKVFRELLNDLGIYSNNNYYILIAAFLYFRSYYDRRIASAERHLILLPDAEAKRYVHTTIFEEADRRYIDEQREKRAFNSLTTEKCNDPFARNVAWAEKQAKRIFGKTAKPGGSDEIERLIGEESGEPGGGSTPYTSGGRLRTVSKKRFFEEGNAGALLGDDLDEDGDKLEWDELKRESSVQYLNRRKGVGRKQGRALETSATRAQQALAYGILRLMQRRGTQRDRRFASMLLRGYSTRQLSGIYGKSSVQDFKRKFERWLTNPPQELFKGLDTGGE
jgi:hypothetical protein